MASVVTINRPDVVALIEDAAKKLTAGNKTEAVALAMRQLLNQTERTGSLFGAHPGSVTFHTDYDPFAPALDPDIIPDSESGLELEHRADLL